MKFQLVGTLIGKGFAIGLLCGVLEVSRSGYYAWKGRPLSTRRQEDERVKSRLIEIHRESRETYGLPRLHESLKAQGLSCGKGRVVRLMREAGVSGLTKKRFKVRTTDSNHASPIAERVFQTEVPETHPTRPNEVWGGDISYIPTEEGFLYFSVYLDLFTRKAVGFAFGETMETSLVLEALKMALGRQGFPEIHHSDRGSQYASGDLRDALAEARVTASMSRKGNCYDNAFVESFFATLKKELIYRKTYKTREEAKKDIFEFIEVWYNRKRIHSSIGFLSPVQFEESLAA